MKRAILYAAFSVTLALLAGACGAKSDSGDEIVAAYNQTCWRSKAAWQCWGDLPQQQTSSVPDSVRGFPVAINLSRPIGTAPLAIGHSHVCALIDRTVECWGSNQFDAAGGAKGKLFEEMNEPVGAWHGKASAIAVGYDFTCAALPDGVECVGGHRYGTSPVRIAGMPGALTRLYSNGGLVCALVDRQLACFGENISNLDFVHASLPLTQAHFETSRTDYPPFPGVPTSVALGGGGVGAGHLCGLVDGAVWCGGDNFAKQVGDSSYEPIVHYPDASAALHFSFHRVALPGRATAIAAGGVQTCAIVDRSLWCWGGNLWGEAAAAPDLRGTAPHEVPGVRGVRAIAAGDAHTCAVTDDGVWCWGHNVFLQLGANTTETCASVQGKADVGPPERNACSSVPVRARVR